jgi:uncharacterized membrane protein
MAAVAGLFGFIDLTFGIPMGTHAKKHGYQHLAFNTAAFALFGIHWWLNSGQWNATAPVLKFGVILPLIGVLCMLAAGYLGWTLVQTDHVGVMPAASDHPYVGAVRETVSRPGMEREFPERHRR